jgi:hypothetical protein
MSKLTVKSQVHFGTGRRSKKQMRTGAAKQAVGGTRVPRIARLMALAIRFDQFVRDGVVADYAELARLGHVTRARMTQIMNLLNLAPDIQERLLFLPEVEDGKDVVTERSVRGMVKLAPWKKQRTEWVRMGTH